MRVPAEPQEGSDAVAIAASLADPEAFSVVFDRHHSAVYRYLARRVGGALAEELAADVFTAAFATRERYDLTRPDASPWLFGIAHNHLRGHLRSERRKLRAYARHGVDPLVDTEGDAAFAAADSRLDAHATGPAVAKALADLRAAERDVLLLVAWAELSCEAAAQALSVPVGTVRSRLHRARRRMRASLASDAVAYTGPELRKG